VLLARWDGNTLVDPEVVEAPAGSSYRLELDNLADAAQGRAPQLLGREDALGQARAIEALYRAADEGRTIAVA
jgi:predicted dehydrogenase